MLKMNVDGSFKCQDACGGWGYVIRDDLGAIIQSGWGRKDFACSPLHMELLACLQGLGAAVQLGIQDLELETDAKQVVDAIKGNDFRLSLVGGLVHEVKEFRGSSVLLKGLSQAQSLVLISAPNQITFKSDLRWCPMFSNLKTLLLNDYWCTPDDFSALACILEYSPVLAKLTLELFSEGPKYKVEMKGRCNLMERSAKISENLNIVEVKCQVVDERVLEVLKFLCTFNISFTF
ncbi:unnamed protein product [Miscanthus lutarioriparius]|uniref:RNase H type-1 domain-containing protein n=1 Tax=Miscanthus lutarioriparius TaxID=422564 RepID=A0A811QNV1_9POAL|nr:unnamed protein product [Miscanthus lutarioriparius]